MYDYKKQVYFPKSVIVQLSDETYQLLYDLEKKRKIYIPNPKRFKLITRNELKNYNQTELSTLLNHIPYIENLINLEIDLIVLYYVANCDIKENRPWQAWKYE